MSLLSFRLLCDGNGKSILGSWFSWDKKFAKFVTHILDAQIVIIANGENYLLQFLKVMETNIMEECDRLCLRFLAGRRNSILIRVQHPVIFTKGCCVCSPCAAAQAVNWLLLLSLHTFIGR